jgi:8-oxo-dGTP pyrophosphatase MutT (NUDIX family)
LIKRKACRAVLLTPDNKTLLLKIANPNGNWEGWITPGGGIEQGEDEISALKRELFEELGLEDFTLGPKLWIRTHVFDWGQKTIEQKEVYYLIKVEQFAIQSKLDLNDSEMMALKEFRWWSLTDILQSKEQFAPSKFPELFYDRRASPQRK